jgi:hypothetical protein
MMSLPIQPRSEPDWRRELKVEPRSGKASKGKERIETMAWELELELGYR